MVNYGISFLSTVTKAHCPYTHPWAYLDGSYCCQFDEEGVASTDGERCDGSKISLNSSCCKEGANVNCPQKQGCVNAGETFCKIMK